MEVIGRSNNNPVYDMTAIMSGLINDLDKAMNTNTNTMNTKSSQNLFG